MKWIGLTGGIGSGKTTVAETIRKSGFIVVDADQISRDSLKKATVGYEKAIEVFGQKILLPSGEIDRVKLGDIVFKDKTKLLELENIIHPLVQAEVVKQKNEAINAGAKAAFYDVPLLFEKKLESQFDAIIVVSSEQEKQIERVLNRGKGLSRGQVIDRLNSQIPMDIKEKKASHVIYNNGSLQDLNSAVKDLLKLLALIG